MAGLSPPHSPPPLVHFPSFSLCGPFVSPFPFRHLMPTPLPLAFSIENFPRPFLTPPKSRSWYFRFGFIHCWRWMERIFSDFDIVAFCPPGEVNTPVFFPFPKAREMVLIFEGFPPICLQRCPLILSPFLSYNPPSGLLIKKLSVDQRYPEFPLGVRGSLISP